MVSNIRRPASNPEERENIQLKCKVKRWKK